MAKTPDNRQTYTCPTCHGGTTVKVKRSVRRKGKTTTETVNEECRQCDGSGTIVGPPT
jgi:DnaJ-class molecular chaperone